MKSILLFASVLSGAALSGTALSAYSEAGPTLTLDALRAKYADRAGHITNVAGVEIYYKDEGSGPAILLVHGSVSSLKTYDVVAEKLRRHYRVIRYDVPGQGLSGTISDAAASRLKPTDIPEQLLLKLGVSSVTAVGVSSGGTLCMYLAAQRPDLVKRLILSNTPSDPVDTSHLKQPQAFVDAQREAHDTHFQTQNFWNLFLTYFSGEPDRMTPSIREQYYDFNRRIPDKNAVSLTAKVADHAKAVEAMSEVMAPTLLVWGAHDPLLTPAAADTLAGYLNHAQVSKLLLPDVGHYPPLEVPERFADIVAAYIEAVTPVEPKAPAPEDR
jgi:pimeloyl-ACP methyl ester carboxylesterase